tara:strand:+ start:4659 stop:5909 length:1251 start_codon:yes stop_codon:yes gene_type:complete
MAEEDLFVRNLDGAFDFVCNRENGQWVLTEESDVSKLTELVNSGPIPEVEFSGTAMTLLNVGRGCNLGCTYCHVSEEKTSEEMPLEVGKKAIDRVTELREEDQTVIFHGSEPVINFPLIRRLISYAQENGVTKFGLQTNGTLLTDEVIDFFYDHHIGVGISLDGLEKHHNQTRPYAGGQSSYKRTIDNLQKVIERLGGVSVISVVTSNNVGDLEEIVEDFEGKGVSSVRFSPLYPSPENLGMNPDLGVLTPTMIKVFETYLAKFYGGGPHIKVSNFQENLRTVFSNKETTNCVKCSGGSRQPLIGIDIHGEIYPCDFFWGREEYRVGDIEEDTIQDGITSPANFRLYRDIGELEDCVVCDWKTFCGSGCPGSSVIAGEGILGKDSYCEHTKAMLEYTVSKIPELHDKKLVSKMLNY